MDALDVGTVLIGYLFLVNLTTFFAFGIDKWKAVHNRWRISERALLGLALAGGSAGGLLGMRLFRHKIRKKRFSVGIPMLLMLQGAFLIAIAVLCYG